MSIECCGKPRTTPFCPLCGKNLGGGSVLGEFLIQTRKTETSMYNYAIKIREQFERKHPGARESEVLRAEKIANKWSAWAEALAELMAKQEE